MKKWLFAVFLFLISCSQKTTISQNSEKELIERARDIHERIITIDTHNDISKANFVQNKNYKMDLSSQVNLPKMIKGGLDVSWLIVYTGQKELNESGYAAAYKDAMESFKAIHRLTTEFAPNQIELALTSEDVRRIIKTGKKVAMIGIENGYPIGLDITRVKEFSDLGARYISLAHNGHSQLSDSNTGERDSVWLHNGLSDLGRKVIAKMNKWGIMVDLSHPSKQANIEMIHLSKAPVIASHSAARTLNNVSRNLSDEELELIKKNGGVVQTVAFKSYLNTKKAKENYALRKKVYASVAVELGIQLKERSELRKMSPSEREEYYFLYNKVKENAKSRLENEVNTIAPPVDVNDFVDHIDYFVKKIGIDHVGISSDFDGGGGVEGWNDASETFNVTLELVRRGYSEIEISKLWGENLLRVLDEVQKVAAELQKLAAKE